jgi:glycosyltransferase involved in cell wall biosynthesis
MLNISIVIITFNEEKNIARCLDSVQGLSNDIVVLDSFSQDATSKICKKYGVRFYQKKFQGYGQQKNLALEYAKNDWVLSLDADEGVSPTLRQAIMALEPQTAAKGYTINRLTNYCGQWIRHCGWYPDAKLRLWHKQYGRWDRDNLHEQVVLANNSQVSHLKGDLFHYSFYTIADHLRTVNRFSDMAAQELIVNNKKFIFGRLLFFPWIWFMKSYFWEQGFRDGFYGLVICVISSFDQFVRYAKALHLKKAASGKG